MSPLQNSAKNVLEVGICDGGSIRLWHDYFVNAHVYGLDVIEKPRETWFDIVNQPRITLFSQNAYDSDFVTREFLDKGLKFDMILDDGPHTLESMIMFVTLYSQVLSDTGLLVVEDVQDYGWIEILKNCVPERLKPFIEVHDLRPNKGRYDDIVFTIRQPVTGESV